MRNLAPLGKLIDIGGWRLHLYGQGLNNTKGPTVIFENGIRGFSFDWVFVQPKVASFAKVYSYDRAGSAWSDLGPRPHTMEQSMYNLHTLLKKAGVLPPYVLVGASHGGLLVRLFAQQYPSEVVGMVLVDAGYENGVHYINGKKLRPAADATGKTIPSVQTIATKEDNNLARTPQAVKAIGDALNKMGYPFTKVEPPFDKLPDSIQKLRLWALSQYEYYAANDNDFLLEEKAKMIQEREKQPYMLEDIPLIVLTATKSKVNPEEDERRLNQASMTKLSRNSKQIIATESSHEIHIEQPELVVDAIRQVVEAVNKKEKLKK
ncbi:MAG TPA: alpha/beta hydrolase [Chitinophagaceae bacterium]|nr:alpha/beta hydrolase [Chitinophagaceae bacterium]